MTVAEIDGATAALADPLRGPKSGREIVVLARSLGDATGRLLAAWGLAVGAAIVLEAESARLVPSALWARPTVFCGHRAEVEELARALAARSGCLPQRELR